MHWVLSPSLTPCENIRKWKECNDIVKTESLLILNATAITKKTVLCEYGNNGEEGS
jgi:hypothetical protein